MYGMKRTTRSKVLENFRPSTEEVIDTIRKTKRKGVEINKNQKGVFSFLFLGVIFYLIILFNYGTHAEFHVFSFTISSHEVAIFAVSYSMVSWVFHRLNIL